MSQEKPEQAQELQTLVLGRTSEETLLLLTSRLSTCRNINPVFAVFLFVHFFAHLFPLPSLCKIYIYTCSLSYLFLIKWSSPWIYLSACTLDFWHFACPPAWLSLPFCVCQPGFPTPSCLLTLSKGSSFIPIYSVVESCFWVPHLWRYNTLNLLLNHFTLSNYFLLGVAVIWMNVFISLSVPSTLLSLWLSIRNEPHHHFVHRWL